MLKKTKLLILVCIASLLSACVNHRPMPTVEYVDLDRFMGDWYVIANIPTFLEKGAHNAIENYALSESGNIDTTFTFYADSFDGKFKSYTPKAFIRDQKSNAEWGMQFVWPIKADYRIVYLDDTYSQVVIGREARDYVWVMARSPQIPEEDYSKLRSLVGSLGYDLNDLVLVPQKWPAASQNAE